GHGSGLPPRPLRRGGVRLVPGARGRQPQPAPHGAADPGARARPGPGAGHDRQPGVRPRAVPPYDAAEDRPRACAWRADARRVRGGSPALEGRRRPRQGGAAQPADRLPGLRLRARHRQAGVRRVDVAMGLIVALLLVGNQGASAPQAEDLQEQLRQLKRQYLDTTQELMRRISALEEELAKEQEARKADAALARSEAAKETAATPPRASAQEFQGQLPSSPRYDLLREAETRIEGLELAAKAFEFHG